MSFDIVKNFENQIAHFFGAPHAIAVDCCTHGLELCLRHTRAEYISVPKNTYLSIPFLAHKLNIDLHWRYENWNDYYTIQKNIYDAAVLWKPNSYITGSFMCVSFQFKKHLSLGRGGVILCDNDQDAAALKKMTYDGRHPDIPWTKQNINSIGYHYYMTPETAQLGLDKLTEAIATKPKQWTVEDWPDLTNMEIFK